MGALAGTPIDDQDLQLRRGCDGAIGELRPFHHPGSRERQDCGDDAIYNNTGGGTNWDAGLSLAAVGSDTGHDLPHRREPDHLERDTERRGRVIPSNDLDRGHRVREHTQGIEHDLRGGRRLPCITASNLELVSGPGQFFVSDIAGLENALQALANQFCGARIHVQKLVGGVAAGGLAVHRGGAGTASDVLE